MNLHYNHSCCLVRPKIESYMLYSNSNLLTVQYLPGDSFGVPPLGPPTEVIWAPDSTSLSKSPSTIHQMWVSVLLPSGQWTDLELTAKQTLLDVKQALENSQGIRVDDQCLVHLGKQLSDDSHSLHAMLKSDGMLSGNTGVLEMVLVKSRKPRMSIDSKK